MLLTACSLPKHGLSPFAIKGVVLKGSECTIEPRCISPQNNPVGVHLVLPEPAMHVLASFNILLTHSVRSGHLILTNICGQNKNSQKQDTKLFNFTIFI